MKFTWKEFKNHIEEQIKKQNRTENIKINYIDIDGYDNIENISVTYAVNEDAIEIS